MLTEHQIQKSGELLNALQEHNVVVLQGSAGVGKTYLLGEIISNLCRQLNKDHIICSAPTHKALAVLRGKVDSPVVFKTAHSVLHYKMVRDTETGEKRFISSPNGPLLENIKYWIIDECSMIDSEMLECAVNAAKTQGTKIIFVGDNKQLNPVGEVVSPVFNRNFPVIELTEIIRQGAGNPIIDLSRNLGNVFLGQANVIVEEGVAKEGYLYTNNWDKIIEKLAESNGTDKVKYLAWTNEEIDRINFLTRKKIYGDNPGYLEVGETILLNAPYKGFTNNEEVTVETLEKTVLTHEVKLTSGRNPETKSVQFNAYNINNTIWVLCPSSRGLYQRYMNLTQQNCFNKKLYWKDREPLENLFGQFKYNHAVTVHKSQGSSYQTTILNVGNIYRNTASEERNRLFYTGITRASNLLILCNINL